MLKHIKDYEQRVDEVVGRHTESSIEADIDRRTTENDLPKAGNIFGRYQKAAKEREYSTIDANMSFVEKYLSSSGIGMGSLRRREMPKKMSKEKVSNSLVRGGISMISASLPMSPGLNQWAASASINEADRSGEEAVGVLKQSITSGETVLLGEVLKAEKNEQDIKSP